MKSLSSIVAVIATDSPMSRTLSGHAELVTARYEAPLTMYLSSLGRRHRSARNGVVLEASIRYRARVSDMVNTCEHLIKTVIHNKPKMLTGLNQKVSGQVQELQISPVMGVAPPVDRVDLNRNKSKLRNTVSPTLSLWVARPQGNAMEQWVKESGESECHSLMEWTGVEPQGYITSRDKRADFHEVSYCERICRTTQGGNCE